MRRLLLNRSSAALPRCFLPSAIKCHFATTQMCFAKTQIDPRNPKTWGLGEGADLGEIANALEEKCEVHKSAHELLLGLSHRNVLPPFKTDSFADMTQRHWINVADVSSRNVELDSLKVELLSRKDLGFSLPTDHRKYQLPIFMGESGSGKTMAMLETVKKDSDACVGLYFRLDDFKGWDDSKEKSPRDAVGDAVVKAVLSKLSTVQGQSADKSLSETTLVVAIDEALHKPDFLRGLCRARCEISKKLVSELSLHQVFVVAAGTGGNPEDGAPGSSPEDYAVHMVPLSSNVFDAAKALASKSARGAAWELLLRVLKEDPVVEDLSKNPRVAMLMMKHAERFVNEWFTQAHDEGVARGLVPTIIHGAVSEYKRMNGAEKLTSVDVHEQFRAALRLVHLGEDAVGRKGIQHLTTSFGMVSDRARWIRGNVDKAKDEVVKIDGNHTLVYAKPRRYGLSAAQRQMLTMSYGLSTGAGWEGFEVASAVYMEMALVMCSNEPAHELFDFLGFAKRGADAEKAPIIDITCVQLSESEKKLEPRKSGEWDDGPFRGQLDSAPVDSNSVPQTGASVPSESESTGAVIVNAPKSAFADVVVAAPHVLLLVQCKDTKKPTTGIEVLAELYKMGFNVPLTLTDSSSLDVAWVGSYLNGLGASDRKAFSSELAVVCSTEDEKISNSSLFDILRREQKNDGVRSEAMKFMLDKQPKKKDKGEGTPAALYAKALQEEVPGKPAPRAVFVARHAIDWAADGLGWLEQHLADAGVPLAVVTGEQLTELVTVAPKRTLTRTRQVNKHRRNEQGENLQ